MSLWIIRQQQQQEMLQAAAVVRNLPPDENLEPRPDQALIRVRRHVDFGAQPWAVVVDGQIADRVGSGERAEFYVHPGWHQVEVRGGAYTRPEPTNFAAAGGEVIDFRIRVETRGLARPRMRLDRRPPGGQIVGNQTGGAPPPPYPSPPPEHQ